MKLLTEEMLNKPDSLEKSNSVTYDLRMLMNEELDFDVTLENGTNLQRELVWTLLQKQQFIISMLKGINIPELYIYKYQDEFKYSTLKIIDGKQRITTLLDFFNAKFPIVMDGVEYYYDELHKWLKSRIYSKPLKTTVFYGYYDDKISDKELVDIFNYVNFTGTPQDQDHMNKLIESVK